jgi:predicted CXXCH cytochrome family protein
MKKPTHCAVQLLPEPLTPMPEAPMKNTWNYSVFCLCILWLSLSVAQAAENYAGSEKCQSCHAQAYESWKGSHHYQAMLPATAENVVGDFSGKTFDYGGVTSRFYRKGDRFFVTTDNAEGELQEFEITYTFGFYPLQQYLIAFPDGRYQALNVVWDSRPQAEGGQRWYHLYAEDDDPVLHDDMVHWTGAFQNWNSRCAVCHSTGLKKNYSADSNSYKTAWKEINVACEACHGPAATHIEWAGGDQQAQDRGFSFSLNDRGAFGPADAEARTFTRLDGKRPTTQVDTCAACHARRSELSDYHAGESFNDQYRLALIDQGLYYPDGQIDDEVYVYGSFLQSKMQQAGVVCTDCHEPHSNAVRMDNNQLCTQCHMSTVFDQPEHHRHPQGSPGAACVNCHMPVKTYMGVDDRHDHSFRVPQPRLTLELGVPNTCNQCHKDKGAQWAIDALSAWGVSETDRLQPARILGAAWAGQGEALPGLLALARQPTASPMLRASAVLATQQFPAQETLTALQQLLLSDDALVRTSAVRSMDWVPEAQRYAMLRDLITDSSKVVRMAVARQLSAFPVDQLPGPSATELNTLFKEYLATMQLNADMPEEQMNFGLYYSDRGDALAAEQAFRHALKLAPAYMPAMLNLADLYRANSMDQSAEPLLRRAIATAPEQAAPYHSLGLLMIRQGKLDEAVAFLQQASEASPQNPRYSYVYAVALWEGGKQRQAVAILEGAVQQQPGNRDLVSALASYYQQLGEVEKLKQLQQQYTP